MAEKNTASSETLKKLEEQLTCPICLEQFTNPKMFPCFHSFCLHCLEGVAPELIEGNLCLPCPTCRFVYVTDSGNNRVQKFTLDGQFVCSFGERQSEPGHLQCPVGITVNEDLIYVNDARDYITVFNKNSGMYCYQITVLALIIRTF